MTMRRFVPSVYSTPSYGDAELAPEAVDVPAATGKSASAQAKEYVDIGMSVVKGLIGSEDAREGAAAVEARLEVARKKKANNAFPGAWYWDDQITKLEHQLVAAKDLAAEDAREAAVTYWRNVGYTVAVFAGVVVIGTIAVNQVQRARKQQAEIERLRAGGS